MDRKNPSRVEMYRHIPWQHFLAEIVLPIAMVLVLVPVAFSLSKRSDVSPIALCGIGFVAAVCQVPIYLAV